MYYELSVAASGIMDLFVRTRGFVLGFGWSIWVVRVVWAVWFGWFGRFLGSLLCRISEAVSGSSEWKNICSVSKLLTLIITVKEEGEEKKKERRRGEKRRSKV
jgi:hypothetical protein